MLPHSKQTIILTKYSLIAPKCFLTRHFCLEQKTSCGVFVATIFKKIEGSACLFFTKHMRARRQKRSPVLNDVSTTKSNNVLIKQEKESTPIAECSNTSNENGILFKIM